MVRFPPELAGRPWRGGRLWGTSARGGQLYTTVNFSTDDGLIFGPETRGLPEAVKNELNGLLRVPIRPVVRSINLATCVGLVSGEALRQTGYWQD